MPPGTVPTFTGALLRLLAGSLVALVFVFRCGDTLASNTLPVAVETNEIGRTEPPTAPTTVRPTTAPLSANAATPTASAATTPGSEPTPEPKLEPSNAQLETTAPPAAPTVAPSSTPIPTVPSTPSPTLTASPIPTAPPTEISTQAPTQAPAQPPTATPTQRSTPTPTQRSTATPTQKPNSAPQLAAIGDQSGKAGQRFVIGVSAKDADGDKITLSCSGGDRFTDYGDGTGSLDWAATKAGKYAFTCSASDGKLSSSTTFSITVN